MQLKIPSAKLRQFCPGEIELNNFVVRTASKHSHLKLWNVITYLCPYFVRGLSKLSKFVYGGAIPFPRKYGWYYLAMTKFLLSHLKKNRLRTCSRIGITVDSAPMFLFRIKYILMLAHNENCVADYVEYKYKMWHRVANMDHLELIDCRLNIYRTYIVWTYYYYHHLCHHYHHHHYYIIICYQLTSLRHVNSIIYWINKPGWYLIKWMVSTTIPKVITLLSDNLLYHSYTKKSNYEYRSTGIPLGTVLSMN